MMDPLRIFLGFDFGMMYIGVATGQTLTSSATPLKTIKAKDGIPDWSEIDDLITTWKSTDLIIGLPLNMDDSVQVMTHRAIKFANRLHERFRLPIHLVDERLSTWEANSYLGKNNNLKKDFNKLNAIAAALLIKQYLQQTSSAL